MENLPHHLVVEILSRLGDSTDLAHCRLSCRSLRSLSTGVRSIAVVSSRDRFLRSRDPASRPLTLPFRSLVLNLLSLLSASGGGALRSLSLAVDEQEDGENESGFDEDDDLHLTAADFLSRLMPLVASGLSSLSIRDYWFQACWRPSQALRLISDQCCGLLQLELSNAWLSVEGLKPMLNLMSLRLEFIRLDDEDLERINKCFPSLQILKLIGVGGLRKPMICLSWLRVCHWAVSNFPLSLAVQAPNLLELKLECVEPKSLVLETPLLSQIDLKIKKPSGLVKVDCFLHLRSVRIETSFLKGIKQLFGGCQTVKKLELDAFNYSKTYESVGPFTVIDIVNAFPNVDDLKLGSGAWTELESSFACCKDIVCEWRNLKRLIIKLPLSDLDIAFMSFLLSFCVPSCEVTMLIHKDTPVVAKNSIIARCTSNFQWFKWKLES